jgi:haloacetate dehalogenase
VHRHYDVLGVWADYATTIQGRPVPSGHYLPEEAPEAVIDALTHFFSGFVL